MRLLIADDDIELCHLLKEYLEQEGFSVSLSHDGQSALEQLSSQEFDLLILDVMMPVKSGFDTLLELRKSNNVPVLMLTAKGEKIDRIVGLEMGADDYVTKPCDPRELVARIRAITRRTNTIVSVQRQEIIIQNDLSLNRSNREVIVKQQQIELTSTEFDFLQLLLENAGTLVSREKLSEKILGKRLQAYDRSIDMHISNLRKKLGPSQDNNDRIKTLRGNGYQYLITEK
jgi:two-component system, OmpR family, response regulator CpxR